MKILILGSSGQIGSYLTKYLIEKNYQVIEFDILNNKREDLTIIPNHYLEESIARADFVYFLAFDVGGSRYLNKYQNTFEFINHSILTSPPAFSIFFLAFILNAVATTFFACLSSPEPNILTGL